MEETTVTIIGMIIAIIMMFVFPLILISERSDDISELVAQTVVADFVDEIIKTGKITEDKYNKFIDSLTSTGNTYDIDVELQFLDINTAKVLDASGEAELGNNTYFSIFTSQIEEKLGNEGKIVLKQGDIISVTVKNSSKTISQTLKSFYTGTTGNDIQIIAATASGTIAINGTT